MPDTLRVVRLLHGKRPIVEYDMYAPDVGGIVSLRDSFKPRSTSAPQTVLAAGHRPRRPGRYVSRTDQPAQMVGTWLVKGDMNTSAVLVEQALAAIDTGRLSRYFEWKPELNEYPVYIPILGPGTFTANYRWVEHSQSGALPIEVSWPVGGVVRGLEWDVTEDFDPGPARSGGVVNLIQNPSFEFDTFGYSGNSAVIATTTSNASNGLRANQATASTPGAGTGTYYPGIPVTAGRTYTFGLNATFITSPRTTYMGIEWRRRDGSVVSATTGPMIDTLGRRVLTGVAPVQATQAYATYYFGTGAVAGNIHRSDAWLFAEGTWDASVYIDGDMPNARWNDVPHASVNTELYDSILDEFSFVSDEATTTTRRKRELVWTTPGESLLLHTGRNMGAVRDIEQVLEFTTPPALVNRELRLRMCQMDVNNYIAFVIDSTSIRVEKIIGGVTTTVLSQADLIALNQRYFISMRREGNRLFFFLSNFTSFGTSSGTYLWSSPLPYGYQLSDAEHAALPSGYDGFSVKGTGVTPGFVVHGYERSPYTYRAPASKAQFSVDTPGTSDGPPCLADVTMWNDIFTQQDWATIMWGARDGPAQRFAVDPDMEFDIYDGARESLTGTGLGGQSGTTTFTDVSWYGTRHGATSYSVSTPATANAGIGYRHPGVFNPGEIVTAEAYVRSPNYFEHAFNLGLTPSLYWRLGASGGITDATANGRNGTALGGITVGGISGAMANDPDNATDFDGVDDRITSAFNPFVNGTKLIVSGWAWRDTSTVRSTLIGSTGTGTGSWVQLWVEPTPLATDVRFTIDGRTNVVTWIGVWPGLAQWVHWGLIFDEVATTNNVTLVINGVSAGDKSLSGAYDTPVTVGTFELGGHGAGLETWDGRMDEVAVWSTTAAAPLQAPVNALAQLSVAGRGAPNSIHWAATPSTGGTSFGNSVTLNSTWQRVSYSYVATKYETDVDLVLRQFEAASCSFYMDDLQFYKGPLLPENATTVRNGGIPPMGWLFMEDSPGQFARHTYNGMVMAGRPATLAHTTAAAGVGTFMPWIDWLINPRAILPAELTDQILVEVFVFLKNVPSGAINLRGTVQTRPYMYFDDVSAAVQWQYGQPYGSSGRSIQVSLGGKKVSKLGTLSFDANENRTQLWDMRVAFSYSAGSTAGQLLEVAGVLLVPSHARAILPTGKIANNTYPSFMPPAQSRLVRTIRNDLSGEYVDAQSRSSSTGPGFGGQPIELPAGRAVDLMVVSTTGVPDDPIATNNQAFASDTGNDLHIGLIPQYNLMAIPR